MNETHMVEARNEIYTNPERLYAVWVDDLHGHRPTPELWLEWLRRLGVEFDPANKVVALYRNLDDRRLEWWSWAEVHPFEEDGLLDHGIVQLEGPPPRFPGPDPRS